MLFYHEKDKKMIFETHAHYNDRKFDEDRDKLLATLPEAGIGRVVNISASWKDLLNTLQLIEKYPYFYGAVGLHPDHIGDLTEERFQMIRDYCRLEKVVAVGEIGLDYHWDVEPRETQKEGFIRQLKLSIEENLPVVIHSRDAVKDTFDIMKGEHAGTTGGIIHCFSASKEIAKEYVKLGYYIGVGGVVTFKNSRVLKEVVESTPLEAIVVETDCPYLAPVPHRGKRNSSLFLPLIIEKIAEIKGCSPEKAEEVTWENACRVYRLPV